MLYIKITFVLCLLFFTVVYQHVKYLQVSFENQYRDSVCACVYRFLISVLYSKAKVAAACAGIIYFLSYVPYMYLAIKEDIANDKIPAVYKTAAVSCLD